MAKPTMDNKPKYAKINIHLGGRWDTGTAALCTALKFINPIIGAPKKEIIVATSSILIILAADK